MKKNLFSFLSLIICMTCNAQLKVNESGNVNIGYIHDYDNLHLFVGDSVNIMIPELSSTNTSIFAYQQPSAPNNFGIIGVCKRDAASSGFLCGIYGVAGNGNSGSFGVAGRLEGTSKGAAIMGTSKNTSPSYNGKYAGLFHGDTFTSGTATVHTLVTLSDARLKEDIVYLDEDGGSEDVHSRMMDVNVISYKLKPSVYDTDDDKRTRYGVLAQELQQQFPDLVVEGQDGYLTVNYLELIPMLICSVQQLQREVDVLRGEKEELRASGQFTGKEEMPAKPSGCALYQNIPNPSNNQTAIRYHIPPTATDASIYILNLQGTLLRDVPLSPTKDQVMVSLSGLNPGIYLYSLVVAGKEIDTKRMIISR